MIRWDHVCVHTWEEVLKSGRDGWELVGVEQGTFFLKRPYLSIREQITREQREQLVQNGGSKPHD